MAISKKDENGEHTMLGTSNTDGVTPIRVQVNPTSKGLIVEDGATGSDVSPDSQARRDENYHTTLLGVSSTDGVTPVPIYANSATGKLLIQST